MTNKMTVIVDNISYGVIRGERLEQLHIGLTMDFNLALGKGDSNEVF